MRVEVSQVIDLPVAAVFRWYADDHVRNHPRWDPDIELWLDTEAPIGLGTVIRRRNRRYGTPIEGTMEVVEYERDRAMAVITREGSIEMRGRATFEPMGPNRTKLTVSGDIAGLDESMKNRITQGMEHSVRTVRELIEAEVEPGD
jgi:hypothetical protein